MSTYLVTGGCGFIGSHLVDRLIEDGNTTIVADDLSTGTADNLNAKAIFHEGSVADRSFVERIFQEHDLDGVIHEASHINTSVIEEDPSLDMAVNVQGTLNLLDATDRFKAGKFVYASSVAVYGSPMEIPVSETGPILPIYSYGIAKQCAEEYVRYYGATRGVDFNIARYGNIYGPRQPIYGEVGVIAIFTDRALAGKSVFVFGDGEHLRDFLFVTDAVEATVRLLEDTGSNTYNVAAGKGTSVNDVVAAFEAAGHKLDVIPKPERPQELGKFAADISRITVATGWVPKYDLASGIQATLNFYQSES